MSCLPEPDLGAAWDLFLAHSDALSASSESVPSVGDFAGLISPFLGAELVSALRDEWQARWQSSIVAALTQHLARPALQYAVLSSAPMQTLTAAQLQQFARDSTCAAAAAATDALYLSPAARAWLAVAAVLDLAVAHAAHGRSALLASNTADTPEELAATSYAVELASALTSSVSNAAASNVFSAASVTVAVASRYEWLRARAQAHVASALLPAPAPPLAAVLEGLLAAAAARAVLVTTDGALSGAAPALAPWRRACLQLSALGAAAPLAAAAARALSAAAADAASAAAAALLSGAIAGSALPGLSFRLRCAVAALAPALPRDAAPAAARAAARAACTALSRSLVAATVDIALGLGGPAAAAAAAVGDLAAVAAVGVAAAAVAAEQRGPAAAAADGAAESQSPLRVSHAVSAGAARAVLHAATATGSVLRLLLALFHIVPALEAAEAAAAADPKGWDAPPLSSRAFSGLGCFNSSSADASSTSDSLNSVHDIEFSASDDVAWVHGASFDSNGDGPSAHASPNTAMTVGPATAALLVAAASHLRTRGAEPARLLAAAFLAPAHTPGLPLSLLAPAAAVGAGGLAVPRRARAGWLAAAATGALTERQRAELASVPALSEYVSPSQTHPDAEADAGAGAYTSTPSKGKSKEKSVRAALSAAASVRVNASANSGGGSDWAPPDSDGEDDASGPAPQARWLPPSLPAPAVSTSHAHGRKSRAHSHTGGAGGVAPLALLIAAAGASAAVVGEAALLALRGALDGSDPRAAAAADALELFRTKEPNIFAFDVRSQIA